MKELMGWSLDGAIDPWSCFFKNAKTQKEKNMQKEQQNKNKTKGLKLHRETIPTAPS